MDLSLTSGREVRQMANGTDLVLLTVPLSAYCLNKFKPTIEYFDHTMQDLKTIL